jgi:GTP cyclohydrolase II
MNEQYNGNGNGNGHHDGLKHTELVLGTEAAMEQEIQRIITLNQLTWLDEPAMITERKALFESMGLPIVERLAECDLPVRLRIPMELTPEQQQLLGLESSDGTRYQLTREVDTFFKMTAYGDHTTGYEHVVLSQGLGPDDELQGEDVPVRIHSSCWTAEVAHASNCDCNEQLRDTLNMIQANGRGALVWLYQEGRGNGLAAKMKQINEIVHNGKNTHDAYIDLGYASETRDFMAGAQIMQDMGISSIRLITNNPDKINQASQWIQVNGIIPCVVEPFNRYVKVDHDAKAKFHGHRLPHTDHHND